MKIFRRQLLLLAAAVVTPMACGKDGSSEPELPGMEKVSYTATDMNIPNPERGFYTPIEIHEASKSPVSASAVNAGRKLGHTLFLLEFHLTDYVGSEIAEDYLDCIRANFASLRENGAKAIVRFCYSNGSEASDKPWDATEELVLTHIGQLKPILQEYYDVILVLQAGFVGSWGEWYYTDNFGFNPKTDADYQPRKHVVDALLDAMPADRQIALRTPEFKMKMYGHSLADTITVATAHQASEKARLGGHNDCYLASSNDTGTYGSKDERRYWAAESLYTIMGGETCGTSSYCHCGPQDGAHGTLADMAEYHFTYLNIGYHQGVIQRWKTEGCFNEIDRRLGYRYVLENGYFSEKPVAGEDFRIVLNVRNDGFAPAQNPRDAELVLTDASGKVVKIWKLNSDPRYWMPGNVTKVDQTIQLPSGISGEMTLSLNLPDPCQTIRSNPRFSIQLANEGLWNDKTGYNKLYSFSL